jgi:hypothetical protein
VHIFQETIFSQGSGYFSGESTIDSIAEILLKRGTRLIFYCIMEWGKYFLERVGKNFTWRGRVGIFRGDWVEIFYSWVEIFYSGVEIFQGGRDFSGDYIFSGQWIFFRRAQLIGLQFFQKADFSI